MCGTVDVFTFLRAYEIVGGQNRLHGNPGGRTQKLKRIYAVVGRWSTNICIPY